MKYDIFSSKDTEDRTINQKTSEEQYCPFTKRQMTRRKLPNKTK